MKSTAFFTYGYLFITIVFTVPASGAADRFLYVLGCAAELTKIETGLRAVITRVDLATTGSGRPFIPHTPGTLDGCLTYQADYDPVAGQFYTVVPRSTQPTPEGTKDFDVLSVSVPGLQVARVEPAGKDVTDPPHIALDSRQSLVVTPAADWVPQTEVDLSGFVGAQPGAHDQILEASGSRVLLQVFQAGPDELTLAVADTLARTLIYLRDLPETVAAAVHLAPGGSFVLVEETSASGTKIGRLVVFDVSSGEATSRFPAPTAPMAFLAISPDGQAIFHRQDAYRFVRLGLSLPNTAVTRPFPGPYPAHFFADR